MSLALKVFTDNFIKGLQLGTSWQDKAEDREIKKSTLRYQLAKMEQDAAYKRATLSETARRNSAYITQSGAYADYLRAKGANIGKGKGGPAGPDANVQAFLLDPRVNEPGLATPPPAAPSGGGGGGSDEQMVTPPAPPPPDDAGAGGSDDGYRRGGRVPFKRKYAQGGRAYEEPYQGLHNRPYATEDKEMQEDADAAAGKLAKERRVDPREGSATGWGNVPDASGRRPGDDSEFRFAGGGSVGSGLQSRLNYQVRRAEQSARVTGPGRGIVKAPSFDPVPRMARGGPVAMNTRPPSLAPSAGTSGPGSGFGEVAAPPVNYASRYANGGSVNDPLEDMWNSFYKQTAQNAAQASRPVGGGMSGGSANAATGSGGDAAGGASGTGGVGGSATDGAGGSAAAGVGGDDGGTYAYGGGVGGRMLSAFGSAAAKGSRAALNTQSRTQPTAPLPAPTIQRTASTPVPYDTDTVQPNGSTGYQRGGTVRRFADGGNTGTGDYNLTPDAVYGGVTLIGPDGKPYVLNDRELKETELFGTRTRPEMRGIPTDEASQKARIGSSVVNVGTRHIPTSQYGTQQGPTGADVAVERRPGDPVPYEPGDSGPPQPPEQTMPPVTVTASRGNGGPPQRRLLGDQARTAAYDPEADRMDPRNTGIVEPGGGVNERVWRATPEAHPDAYPADNKGMFGERLDRPGPHPVAADATTGSAINIGAPTAPSTAPDNYAAKGASRYASNTFQGQDEHALFAGKGAATHTEIADVFKIVDPDNKMPMHERMIAAQKAGHDYWMAKGDPKQADQAAFEIGQFGNSMAREHGAKAAKAIQSGDQKTALNELLAGYGWLPDGGTPEVQNNAIVIRGADGKVNTTIPLQQGTLLNLALGMSTGQLGWDVMHAAAGKQPASSGPTAQPQAASAGPQPSPAAPQGGAQAPNAGGQGAGEPAPAPQVAQAQPVPTAPPSAGAPAPVRPAPAPARPAPAPVPAPQQMGPEGGAISTAPPTVPAAPAPTPQVPPTAGAAAPAPSSQTPSKGQGQRVPAQGDTTKVAPGQPQPPEQKTPEQEKAERADAEQKYWSERPYQPTREPNSAEQRRDMAIEQARRENIRAEQDIVKAANEHGLAVKGKLPTAVTQAIAAKKKIYEDKVKAAEADYRNDHAERQRNNVPRTMSLNDYTSIDGTLNSRVGTLTKAPAGSIQAKQRDDSVLRYATGDDQNTIKEIATNIWQHNKGLSPQQAMDLALHSTSILRPSDQEKDPVGQNRQKGAKATYFRPSNRGDKNLTYLTFGDGTNIKVDSNTYQRIAQQHAENWANWQHSQTAKGQQEARDKKNAVTWKTVGSAIRTGGALVPGLPLVEAGAEGLIRSMNSGR